VFTPDGASVALPSGSTAVDFAYATSPGTADTALGVLVNGMRKPMENRLAHGQVVELVTGAPADPPQSWLAAAHSGQARTHIQQSIARRQAEEASATGRARLAAALAARGADLLDLEGDGTAFSLCRRLGHSDLDALYESVGRGDTTVDTLLGHLGLPAGLES